MSAQKEPPYRDREEVLLGSALLERILAEEERTLLFDTFDGETAFQLGASIRQLFLDDERYHQGGTAGMALSIILFNGLTLFHTTVGTGVTLDNMEWLKRKTRTVQRFGVSSWLRRQVRLDKNLPADDPLLGPEYASHGGSFPINIKNVTVGPIGAITVSGMTQELDHEIIVKALRRWIAKTDRR